MLNCRVGIHRRSAKGGEGITNNHDGSRASRSDSGLQTANAEQARKALIRLRRAAADPGEPISREEILTWIAEARR